MSQIAHQDYTVVNETTTVFELLSKLQSSPVTLFLVAGKAEPVSAGDIKGVVSKERLADAMTDSINLFAR